MENSLYPIIQLSKGKEDAVKRFHPWVFSGAIAKAPAGLQAGDTVTLTDYKGDFLATGFCETGSIAVKIVSFDNVKIDEWFFLDKIGKAFAMRQKMGITTPATNCYRLVHSEGDGLAGLIIDVYGHTAVVQAQTEGMALHINEIARALKLLPDSGITAVYNKSAEAMQRMGKDDKIVPDGYLLGSRIDEDILENGMRLCVDWEEGQKTGFFLDQRENRALLRELSKDAVVLNAFGYTGGFSIAALLGGAKRVVTVDASRKAIALAEKNISANGFDPQQNPCLVADMKEYIVTMPKDEFNVIVLDPPAFAKRQSDRTHAMKGYRFINAEAIRRIAKNGLLFTFSCSQVIDDLTFRNVVTAAAIDAGRNVRILHRLSQPADHPVSIFHPEGSYLKGLVLYVE